MKHDKVCTGGALPGRELVPQLSAKARPYVPVASHSNNVAPEEGSVQSMEKTPSAAQVSSVMLKTQPCNALVVHVLKADTQGIIIM